MSAQGHACDAYATYARYHSHPVNKAIHCVFVPLLHVTASVELSALAGRAAPLLFAACYGIYYALLDVGAAAACLPYLVAVCAVTHVVCASVSRAVVVPAAAGLHIVSWGVQIYGHAVYEGGMPALSESVVGSIATAPLFVVLEMLWSMGYALPLRKRLAAEDRR